MKRGAFLVVLVIAGLGGCATQLDHAPSPSNGALFPWMLGTWRTTGEGAVTTESWRVAPTGEMIGAASTVKDGKELFAESMVIERRADGTVYFVASPQGQDTHAFAMLNADGAQVAFEDKSHDFPYRISYILESPDVLVGRIYGVQGGQERSASWRYQRVVD
ncbi:MAG: hypothetical protein KDA20_06125 [Phycisphaerales bacterium]|nr:hypothetical protein [Phycisphaerales bacterium]